MSADMDRINHTIAAARGKRLVTMQTILDLEHEKTRMLARGQHILIANDCGERERWLAEYQSLCRRVNENRAELGDAA